MNCPSNDHPLGVAGLSLLPRNLDGAAVTHPTAAIIFMSLSGWSGGI